MKASELIVLLQNEIEKHGDLKVGVRDREFCEYVSLKKIAVRNAARGLYETDDISLGEIFIGMTYEV